MQRGLREDEMRFRKKPVVIEAFENGTRPLPEWFANALDDDMAFDNGDGTLTIRTLEGDHLAQRGDWIIQGIKGELYPCKPDIFAATYEIIEEAR
jgi:hypothetical protein